MHPSLREPELSQLQLLSRYAHERGVEVTHSQVMESLWKAWHRGEQRVTLQVIAEFLCQQVRTLARRDASDKTLEAAAVVMTKFLNDLQQAKA